MSKIIADVDETRATAIVDTRGAVVINQIDTAIVHGRTNTVLIGLELQGPVLDNPDVVSDVLYLLDAEGAASVCAHLVEMCARTNDEISTDFIRSLSERLGRLAGGPKGGR